MGIQFYKPNPRSTGSACSWSFKSGTNDDRAIFLEMIKQKGWDQENKKASFDKTTKTIVKLDPLSEVGAIIALLGDIIPVKEGVTVQEGIGKLFHALKFFHKNAKGSKSINFEKTRFSKEGEEVWTMNLSVKESDNENRYSIYFNRGEATSLRLFLEFAMERIFTSIHSADKKRFEASQKKKKEEEDQPLPLVEEIDL